jgi:hypothetical protein
MVNYRSKRCTAAEIMAQLGQPAKSISGSFLTPKIDAEPKNEDATDGRYNCDVKMTSEA